MLGLTRRSESCGTAGAAPRGTPAALVARGDVSPLQWILRVAVAAEFIGHGAFGIITKAAWVPYFGVFGIPEWLAWRLMPVVGTMDICLGVATLVYPTRAILLHMSVWGLMTATLRPLTGESVFELLERAYNAGVPFAFLLLAGFPPTLRGWFARIDDLILTTERQRQVALCLRIAIGLSLIGHGSLVAFTPERWTKFFSPFGIPAATVKAFWLLHGVGGFEVALGLAILAAPMTGLLVFVCLWKVGTEALRLPIGEPIWEVVERGSAYAAPLALLCLKGWPKAFHAWLR